tara:strand:- start:26 stop:748 length:723 start_codon:yes stop_codon:yes gene_type:complete
MLKNSKNHYLESVNTLTFDLFGTVLNLSGSIIPKLEKLLRSCNAPNLIKGSDFWNDWRQRQRIEQYQENLLMLGHSGYLNIKKKSLIYTLRTKKIKFDDEQIENFMSIYYNLIPFEDAINGLYRLGKKYKLVILSNGEESFLKYLAEKNIGIDFHAIFSAEMVGQFKPHPSVYRFAAKNLNLEPNEIMMVASHSFDILGARHSGFRAAYVNRYDLPYDESDFEPDIITEDFNKLCIELNL